MGDNKKADQFSGLDMSAIIEEPLKSACEAQSMMEKATADFIEKVGLEDKDASNPDAVRKVRNTTFSYTRSTLGEADESGKIVPKQEEVTMSVPFLGIVNVPSLAISDVDVTFDMEVKSSTPPEITKSDLEKADKETQIEFGLFRKANVSIKGSASSSEKNTRSTDNSAKYHVPVKARDQGTPEDLQKILDTIKQSMTPINVDEIGDNNSSKN